MSAPAGAARPKGAAHLSAETLASLRALLVDELSTQVALVDESRAIVAELTGQTDSDSVLEREMAEAAVERSGALIPEVEAAIARIDNGTYGNCEACGAPIPAERLEAIPHARRCVACPESRGGLLG